MGGGLNAPPSAPTSAEHVTSRTSKSSSKSRWTENGDHRLNPRGLQPKCLRSPYKRWDESEHLQFPESLVQPLIFLGSPGRWFQNLSYFRPAKLGKWSSLTNRYFSDALKSPTRQDFQKESEPQKCFELKNGFQDTILWSNKQFHWRTFFWFDINSGIFNRIFWSGPFFPGSKTPAGFDKGIVNQLFGRVRPRGVWTVMLFSLLFHSRWARTIDRFGTLPTC